MTADATTVILTADAFRRGIHLATALREQAREIEVSFTCDNAHRAREHRAKLGDVLALLDALLVGEDG